MKNPKVRLYLRVRRYDGTDHYANPAFNKNRTPREGYALIFGQAEHHPEGVYYLRFARCGKPVWQSVGKDSRLALAALRNKEHDLHAVALGRSTPEVVPASPVGSVAVSVQQATDLYLEEIRAFRSAKTISACEHMLKVFATHYGERTITEITRTDLLAHMVRLQSKGLGPRTIFNHTARINTFLKANDVVQILRPADWPKFDEKAVSAYHPDQLAALFATASAEERMLFQFFLATGFREQEVMHCTWSNVDFRDCVISVRSKPEYGFRPKDKEERTVPVPDGLILALTARKRTSSSALLFPGRGGKPDGHYLRKLQKLAFRAGLNCGECTTRGGKSCLTTPVCRRWGLHEFRRTFATSHSESGVPPSTIQRWLGHSDLTTTLRYLAIADLRSDRTRSQVNASFSFMTKGMAA